MTSQEIKTRMDEKNLTPRKVVRILNRSRTTVHLLIHKRLKSDKLEERFAKLLDMTLDEYRSDVTDGEEAQQQAS
jgi:hypothetical protein